MAVSRAISLFGNGAPPIPFGAQIKAAALVGCVAFAVAFFGNLARPAVFLAAIWPANALLLGWFVRRPRLATPLAWSAAGVGCIAAAVLTGTPAKEAVLLTLTELTGITIGFALFMRRDLVDRRLRRPTSVLYLALIVSVASAASGVAGVIVMPFVLNQIPISGWINWFATAVVNYIMLLPVILTMPALPWLGRERRRHVGRISLQSEQIAPIAALALACLASAIVGGPGAVAFPVPALLWCAVTYSQFSTAVLTLIFSCWTMSAIALGYIVDEPMFDTEYALMSIRIGIALMALAPITVASVMAARNELLQRLQHLASCDPLTGALNRRAFFEAFHDRRTKPATRRLPISVLMLDIDHFKRINDTFGHAAGDQVLTTFVRTVQECLRGSDVFGRLGGEEFAALMTSCTGQEAEGVAERIRSAIAGTIVRIGDGCRVTMTVSIGVADADQVPAVLEPLLSAADKALYAAKTSGRNRVVAAA
jgi:diguanylate cyclase (GGDEF)-like protein